MKKFFSYLILGLMACLSLASCSDDDDEVVVPIEELPSAAKVFLNEFYPSDKTMRVERDGEHAGTEYDVTLSSGAEIEFDRKGEWISVEAPRGGSVPAGLVIAPIAEYITVNYPNDAIVGLSKEIYGFETDLSSGTDLMFDFDGKFLGVDRD